MLLSSIKTTLLFWSIAFFAMVRRRFGSAFALLVALCISFSLFFLWTHVPEPPNVVSPGGGGDPPPPPLPPADVAEKPQTTAAPTPTKLPKYKDFSDEKKYPPIEDNFPIGQSLKSRKDFPKIPSWNRPPSPHIEEKTPLFIGFTRNVRMSLQFSPAHSNPLSSESWFELSKFC